MNHWVLTNRFCILEWNLNSLFVVMSGVQAPHHSGTHFWRDSWHRHPQLCECHILNSRWCIQVS